MFFSPHNIGCLFNTLLDKLHGDQNRWACLYFLFSPGKQGIVVPFLRPSRLQGASLTTPMDGVQGSSMQNSYSHGNACKMFTTYTMCAQLLGLVFSLWITSLKDNVFLVLILQSLCYRDFLLKQRRMKQKSSKLCFLGPKRVLQRSNPFAGFISLAV